MKLRLAFLSLVAPVLAPSIVRADAIGADPNDPGRVTFIAKGVKEIDTGGLLVLSYNKSGDAEASTRLSTLGGVGFQYFLKHNVSAGANFLFNYDRLSATTYSTGFGGTVFASLHVRLGLGAFLRPTFGVGALFGDQKSEVTPGTVVKASQVAGLVRIGLPFAYFPSRRVVLQAGPEINVLIGNVTPSMGEAQSFTSIAGGFGVNAGYAF